MLRIVREVTGEGRTEVLRLEGQVVGRWVDELCSSCHKILSDSSAPLALDLKDVTFIDVDGVALLKELSARGVRLTNCSLFTAEQLREPAAGSKPVS